MLCCSGGFKDTASDSYPGWICKVFGTDLFALALAYSPSSYILEKINLNKNIFRPANVRNCDRLLITLATLAADLVLIKYLKKKHRM